MVEASSSNARDVGSILSWEAKIPYASWPKNQNIKLSNIVTNSIKTQKRNGPHRKKKNPIIPMLRILFNLILVQKETMTKVPSFAIQSRIHEAVRSSTQSSKQSEAY